MTPLVAERSEPEISQVHPQTCAQAARRLILTRRTIRESGFFCRRGLIVRLSGDSYGER